LRLSVLSIAFNAFVYKKSVFFCFFGLYLKKIQAPAAIADAITAKII